MGMAKRLLMHCKQYDQHNAFTDILEQVEVRQNTLHKRLLAAVQPTTQEDPVALRADFNDHLSRLALTLQTLAKGTGYATHHNAQRDIQEAHFFLVWSAPTPLRYNTLTRLWDIEST
tara:strand:- start:234 stop:584 length:351 start_codon:yes stop_codon:yes gene_type:complete